jgi:Zn-dependent M28 family amino/carboxypeptidase
MRPLLVSVIRITMAVIAGTTLLTLGAGCLVRQPIIGTVAFPGATRADAGRIASHVRFLADPVHPRDWRHPEGLERASSYIAGQLGQTGARVSEQPYTIGKFESKNVIAKLGPETGPRIVIGAHYDACGPHPGADDNASGVAGLLELARLLDRQALSSPVELVAYSTEEPPWFGGDEMGSAHHAASLARSGAEVSAMISLEMIGYFVEEQPPGESLLLRLLYPSHGEFIAVVGRWQDRGLVRRMKTCFRGATDVQAVSYSGPAKYGVDLSDQRSYWAHGFPGIMVTDTAFLRSDHYHSPTDTADTLDYRRLAGVVDGVFSTVVHLANPN